jgi:cysteine desulfurase
VIYLDYNATTPVDERVVEAMLPWFTATFWNAASAHAGGRIATEAVEQARSEVARLIGAQRSEIVWTSGATEANNLALMGAVAAAPAARRRLITTGAEHKAVLDVASHLRSTGSSVTVLPVDRLGRVSLDHLEDELSRGDTAVVSVMAANNETGVLTDLVPITDLVHEHGGLLHTDATQIVGKLPFDVQAVGIDLASVSAHKLYGPKGVGALYVQRRVRLDPVTFGGGHERGLRSGTLNVPGIVGFGRAASLALGVDHADRLSELRDHLTRTLTERVGDVEVMGGDAARLPNTANLRFVGADAEAVMANAPEVMVSSGSACTALTPEPSHVLLAMGLDRTASTECLRISVGRPTRRQEVDAAVEMLGAAVDRVRALNEGATG